MLLKWSAQYKLKNIKMFVETAILSAFAANLFAPILILFAVYKTLNINELIIWMSVHIFILSARLFLRNKIITFLKSYDTINNKYTNYLLFFTSFTALLYGYIIWSSVLQKIPAEELFLLSSIIIVLTAGSISTLMSVFRFFSIFVLINMLSIMSAVFYYGGNIFEIYGILLILFTGIFLRAGYQQYTLIDDILSLKDAFESIYEKSADGICLVKGHQYKDCNPAFVQMFLFDSKEDFLATPVSEIMPSHQANGKSSLKEMLRISKETLKTGHYQCDWTYKKRDGTIFWTEIVFTKIYIDDEELIHGVVRDITLKKELEQQKKDFYTSLEFQVNEEVEKNRQKDKAMLHQSKLAQMGEILSMIAHQWRQPLSAISATSGSLSVKAQLGTLDKEMTIELSNKITEYTQYLSTTIDDFRSFFKPEKQKSNVSLVEPIHRALKIVETSMENKGIKLVTNFHTEDKIFLYQNEIMQVILNILKNAEDNFLEKKTLEPTIHIKTNKEDDSYIISISDNGGGIPTEILSKIFHPYFSTKNEKDGTGLGLYMSKIIIEEHHEGELQVKNRDDGVDFNIVFKKKD